MLQTSELRLILGPALRFPIQVKYHFPWPRPRAPHIDCASLRSLQLIPAPAADWCTKTLA
jgi:hypothetical protein